MCCRNHSCKHSSSDVGLQIHGLWCHRAGLPFLHRLGSPHVSYRHGAENFDLVPDHYSFDLGAISDLVDCIDDLFVGRFDSFHSRYDLGLCLHPDVRYWWSDRSPLGV